jgi:hypothetical protein
MIALEFLPPLVFLALAKLRRRPAVALLLLPALLTWPGLAAPAWADTATSAPSPQPAAPPPTSAPTTLAPSVPTVAPTAAAPVPAPQVAPPTPPQPAPLVGPTPSSASATPALAPTAQPQAGPAPTLVPTPTPNPFTYIINPPPVATTTPDGPHILQVDLNDRRIHAGGPLIVRVFTSANVVGVEARALGRFIPIPQSSEGIFALAYTMPGAIPFWLLNRNYDIVIAAATADGRQTTVAFPMLLMR